MTPDPLWPFTQREVFIYLIFLAVLGLRFSLGFSQVAASRGYSLAVARGLLIAVASLVDPWLWEPAVSVVAARESIVVARGL